MRARAHEGGKGGGGGGRGGGEIKHAAHRCAGCDKRDLPRRAIGSGARHLRPVRPVVAARALAESPGGVRPPIVGGAPRHALRAGAGPLRCLGRR